MGRKVTALAYHRNGVCGTGFYAAILTDEDGSEKVVIRLPNDAANDGVNCAVLDLGILAGKQGAERIAFGLNSWRGDHYAPVVDEAIVASMRESINTLTKSRKERREWLAEERRCFFGTGD